MLYCGIAAGAIGLSVAVTANAHIELLNPTPRSAGQAGGNDLKNMPCGQAVNGRTEKITTFSPGQRVDVQIKEYVQHPGYFMVAFDADGDDSFPPPRANMDLVDAAADDPKVLFPIDGRKVLGLRADVDKDCFTENPDNTCSIPIVIPNMTCQNCTLQVTQFMYDSLGDRSDDDYYYQCADIEIAGPLSGDRGDTGGCSVAFCTQPNPAPAAALCMLFAWVIRRRRVRHVSVT